jgi:carboxylesterase
MTVTLMPGAEPWSHDGDSTGVLLIHGFTGSPKSMTPWGKDLAAEGWTVRVPRLPGHGTTWQEMNRTTWEDWYAETDRAFRDLQGRCRQVFVMGLSMGGCLALRLAEQHGDAVAGLVLVNPSVLTERKDRFLLPVMRHVVPSFPGVSNDIAKPGVDEGAYTRVPLRAAHSLSQLWSVTRRDIATVTQPLLMLRSAVDQVVEASGPAFVLAHVSSADVTEVVLPDSFHVATLDYDAPMIVRDSIAFVRRLQA